MAHPSLVGFSVSFSKAALKFLQKLDKGQARKIFEKIQALKSDSESLDIKKLKSPKQIYRLRVGDFRVIYSVLNEKVEIYVITVGHRRDVYKNL